MSTERNKMNECYSCTHKREVAGNTHILCAKPDSSMEGNPHGVKSGWFVYPILFDPCWKAKECKNFEESPRVSRAVSQPVSSAE